MKTEEWRKLNPWCYRARNREEREDWVIRSLRRDGPMDTTEIRDAFGVRYPALEALERRGLIRSTGVEILRGGRGGGPRRIRIWSAP